MDEPLYGFIVEVTVSENQTCQISPSSEENIMQQCQLLRDDNENDIEIDSEECSDHDCLYDEFDRQGNTGLRASRPQCRFSRS